MSNTDTGVHLFLPPNTRMASPENIITESDNIMACEAISTRLAEVAQVAEALDSVLSDVQGGFDDEVEELTSADAGQEVAAGKRSDSGNQSDVSVLPPGCVREDLFHFVPFFPHQKTNRTGARV